MAKLVMNPEAVDLIKRKPKSIFECEIPRKKLIKTKNENGRVLYKEQFKSEEIEFEKKNEENKVEKEIEEIEKIEEIKKIEEKIIEKENCKEEKIKEKGKIII
jgi:hypothetical protein